MPSRGYLFQQCQRSCRGKIQVKYQLTSSLLGLAERISATGKDLVKVVLEPTDIGAESGELPLAVDLLIPVLVGAVGMAFDSDG